MPLTPANAALRIPQMGWNALIPRAPHPILAGIEVGSFAYFVHSFHAVGAQPEEVIASVDYGGQVVAIIGRKHIIGTQFHPEKSQRIGLKLLKNFLAMR